MVGSSNRWFLMTPNHYSIFSKSWLRACTYDLWVYLARSTTNIPHAQAQISNEFSSPLNDLFNEHLLRERELGCGFGENESKSSTGFISKLQRPPQCRPTDGNSLVLVSLNPNHRSCHWKDLWRRLSSNGVQSRDVGNLLSSLPSWQVRLGVLFINRLGHLTTKVKAERT